jgi:hypothetical protein
MKNLPIAPPASRNLAFNRDGAELYTVTTGFRYNLAFPEAVAVSLATDSVEAVISTPGRYLPQSTAVAASVNPVTLKPVVYEWGTGSDNSVFLNMIDTDPASPTFNTVLQTLYAGSSSISGTYSGAATPDGKYVYVDYYDTYTNSCNLAIFDVVHGTASTIPTSTLEVYFLQHQGYVTPDGQSLLLSGSGSNPVNPSAGPIKVLDISADPKHPTLVTTIAGTPPLHVGGTGQLNFVSYVVVNGHLFALDVNQGLVMAFNFDRVGSNFSQLGVYALKGNPFINPYLVSQGIYGVPYLAASPDGAYLYVPIGGDDMITVLDANLLANGQPPLVTNIGTGRSPVAVDVNPVKN